MSHWVEADWTELPPATARFHRDDLTKPCGQCGATLFNVVLVQDLTKEGVL